MKTASLFFICWLLALHAYSQDNSKFSIAGSYLHESTMISGMRLQADYTLAHIQKTKNGRKKTKTFDHELFIGVATQYSNHKYTNHSFAIGPEIGYRITRQNGLFCDVSIGTNYLAEFNSGTTYTVTDNGVTKESLFATSYFMPTLGVSLGQDLSKKHNLPLAWFIRPSFGIQMPYNTTIVPKLYAEFGIRYSL